MKVAILGGTGFLGGYIIEKLIKEGHNPIILTRKKFIQDDYVHSYRTTDYSRDSLKKNLIDVDAVIHLAAKRGSNGEISEFHDNEILTQNLYDVCAFLNIKNIVYASTISVYSIEADLPWSEKCLTRPKLMYGVSKLACENIGNIYSEREGLCIKNLRFAHLYGFNEKNNYMINKFFRLAFNKKKLVLDTKSIAKREFLYVKDAANAVYYALNKQNLHGTFNIGSNRAFTNYEVAEIINLFFENKDNLEVKDINKEETIRPSYMNNKYAKEVLGFKCEYTFEDSLKEIYDLMKGLDYVPLSY